MKNQLLIAALLFLSAPLAHAGDKALCHSSEGTKFRSGGWEFLDAAVDKTPLIIYIPTEGSIENLEAEAKIITCKDLESDSDEYGSHSKHEVKITLTQKTNDEKLNAALEKETFICDFIEWHK